jgi:hypothetical protein
MHWKFEEKEAKETSSLEYIEKHKRSKFFNPERLPEK